MNRSADLRIGIVGCGRAAESLHLPCLRKISGVRVTALSDTDAPRLSSVADRFGIAGRYRDYQALVDDSAVDLVAVCVPAAHHAGVACAALEAGKHVYVEKPMALTDDAALAMTRAAAGAAGKSTVGFNLRSHRLVAQAKAIIESGALGPIEMLRTAWTAGFHYSREWPDWRYRRTQGGGVFFEIASHHADLWRHLLDDEVERLHVESRSQASADDMSASITARMSGGTLVSSAFCQCTSDRHDIEIYGREGILSFSCYRADSLTVQPTANLGGGPRARIAELARRFENLPATFVIGLRGGDYQQSYAQHWQSFVDSIIKDTPPPCTLEDGAKAVSIILAAVESVQRHTDTPTDHGEHERRLQKVGHE